jgi:hypothetical protein
MLLAEFLTESKDPILVEGGKLASAYWMGRLNGEMPNGDLEKELLTQAAVMDHIDLQRDAARCDAEMGRRGEELQRASNAAQQKAAVVAPSK